MARLPDLPTRIDSERLYVAEEIVEDAFETDDVSKRLAISERALRISPYCVDAYILLAAHGELAERQRIATWRRAVDVAKRVLGRERFERNVGGFWDNATTRPYMRARLGLANALCTAGRADDAISHYRDLLRLGGPREAMGARYWFADALIRFDRDRELGVLLKAYDGGCAWLYVKALHAFRTHGYGPAASMAWEEAKRRNGLVPKLLCGELPMPEGRPRSYSPGSIEEAQLYVLQSGWTWHRTDGAVEWLRHCMRPASSPGFH